MRKITLFLMSLFLTVGAMAQFAEKNLMNIESGKYYVYHTDVDGVKHYLQIAGANQITTVTENPKFFNVEKNASGAWITEDSGKFPIWYKMEMNNLVISNTSKNESTIETKVFETSGWNDMNWAVQAVFLNEDEEAAIRLTNADADNDWHGHWFIGIGDQYQPIGVDTTKVLTSDLFIWKFVSVNEVNTEATELLKKLDLQTVESECELSEGMFNSNACHNEDDSDKFTGWDVLLDKNIETYFHSTWKNTDTTADYIEINLGENESVQDFCFYYNTRNHDNSGIDSPLGIKIEGRNSNNEEYEYITSLSPNITEKGAKYESPEINATKPYQILRFTVTKTGRTPQTDYPYFAISEFGISKIEKVVPDQYQAVKEEAIDLEKAINNYVSSQSETNTTALLVALETLKTNLRSEVSHTLAVTEAGWATLYLDFPVAIPAIDGEGNGVFIATKSDVAGYVRLTPVEEGTTIPANTGVIVKAGEGNYTFAYSTEDATEVTGNLLKGTASDEYIQGEAYVLADGEYGIGMYKAELNKNADGNVGTTHFLNNAGKAYLPASAVPSSAASSASLRFDFGGTTGVEKVEIRNEKEEIYDLTGRRVNEITKAGVYIIGGRKVLVK